MQVLSFKGTKIELTDTIKDYVMDKLGTIASLTKDFDPVAEVRVEVGKTTNHHKKGEIYRCEFHMHVPNKVLRAEETAEDLYEAIDLCRDDLQRQVKKYKGQLQDRSQKAERPGKPHQ